MSLNPNAWQIEWHGVWMKTGAWAPKAYSNTFIPTVNCTVCEHEICQWIIQRTAMSRFVPHCSTFPSWKPEPSLRPCSRRSSFQLLISYKPAINPTMEASTTGSTDWEGLKQTLSVDIMSHYFFFIKVMFTAAAVKCQSLLCWLLHLIISLPTLIYSVTVW